MSSDRWDQSSLRWHAERLRRIIEREAAAPSGGILDSPSSDGRNSTPDDAPQRPDGLDDLKLLS